MAIGSGLASQFGIATETTPGTPVAVSRFVEQDSDSLSLKRHVAQGNGLRNGLTRRAGRRVLVAREAGGAVPFDLPTNGMGLFLQHMLGSFSTTATQIASTTAYQQIHNTGSLQGKTFTAQKTAPNASTAGYADPLTYPGCKITGWDITCAQNSIAKLSLTIDAWDEATESQAIAPTTLASSAIAGATSLSTVASVAAGSYVPVDAGALVEYVLVSAVTGAGPYTLTVAATKYAHASGVIVGSGATVYNAFVKAQTAVYGAATGLFSFKDARLIIGGTTSNVSGIWTNTGGVSLGAGNGFVVRAVNLKAANPLKVDRIGAGSQLKIEQLENNFRDYTGSIDLEYTTRQFYDLFQQDLSIALVIPFVNQQAQIGTSGQYPSLQFYMPLIKFEDGASPMVPGPDIVVQKLGFTALDDGVNGTLQGYLISSDTTP